VRVAYFLELLTGAFSDTWKLVVGRSLMAGVIAFGIFVATLFLKRYRNRHDDAKTKLIDWLEAAAITCVVFVVVFALHFFYVTPRRMVREARAALPGPPPPQNSSFIALAPSHTETVEIDASKGAAVSVVAEAGNAPYTYSIKLKPIASAGAGVEIYIELPEKNRNPTIEVWNGGSSPTLLHTINGHLEGPTFNTVRFRFNGTAWVKFGSEFL
jgi:amino acid transporter